MQDRLVVVLYSQVHVHRSRTTDTTDKFSGWLWDRTLNCDGATISIWFPRATIASAGVRVSVQGSGVIVLTYWV